MSIFEIVYWIAILVEVSIRKPLNKVRKQARKTEQRISLTETVLLGVLLVTMFLLPLVYSASDWLDFADYQLPTWMGWLGVVLMTGAMLVFLRAHLDLKHNWSPSLEVFEGHTLVTSGIYATIRHPIYASQWLWVLAQPLLIQNWIAGPINLVFFIIFYALRVPAEERMMLDTFGKAYADYMKKTGGVIPRLR